MNRDDDTFLTLLIIWAVTFALTFLALETLKGCHLDAPDDPTHPSKDGWR